MNDKRWITKNGVKILINNHHPITFLDTTTTHAYMNDMIKTTKTSTHKEREQISLTYAKQRFKNKYMIYGAGAAFEDSILNYNLQKDEIKSLYEYARKNYSKWEDDFKEITDVYERYKDGIKPYEW